MNVKRVRDSRVALNEATACMHEMASPINPTCCGVMRGVTILEHSRRVLIAVSANIGGFVAFHDIPPPTQSDRRDCTRLGRYTVPEHVQQSDP